MNSAKQSSVVVSEIKHSRCPNIVGYYVQYILIHIGESSTERAGWGKITGV